MNDLRVLLFAPAVGAIFLSGQIARQAQGDSILLRLVTMAAILSAVLAGNIWGFRSAVMQNFPITWGQAIPLYFTHQLRVNGEIEIWYFLGGAVGAWIGKDVLRSAGFLRVD